MKATLRQLKGKYYGTKIDINYKKEVATIDIWLLPDGSPPSERELATWGYTKKQWDNNELVDNGWGGKDPIRTMDITCDGHYESVPTFEFATELIRRINDYQDKETNKS